MRNIIIALSLFGVAACAGVPESGSVDAAYTVPTHVPVRRNGADTVWVEQPMFSVYAIDPACDVHGPLIADAVPAMDDHDINIDMEMGDVMADLQNTLERLVALENDMVNATDSVGVYTTGHSDQSIQTLQIPEVLPELPLENERVRSAVAE